MMFENYLAFAKLNNACSSIKKVEGMFKNYIEPFYGDADMRDVEISEHTELMSMILLVEKRSPATVNRVRALLAAMYNVAMRKRSFGGAIKENPFTAIDPLDEEASREPFLFWETKQEIDQFMRSEQEHNPDYYPLWVYMLNTGVRIGEALGTHAAQFNKTIHQIRIDRQFCCASNKIVPYTKGRKNRSIGLNSITRETLYSMLDKFPSGPIFKRHDGKMLTTFYIDKEVLPQACERAGVKYIGAHGFRHTFGSHWMMSGRSIWDLQKILGHADIQTTEKHYAHFSPEHVTNRSNVFALGPVEFPMNVTEGDFEGTVGAEVGVSTDFLCAI